MEPGATTSERGGGGRPTARAEDEGGPAAGGGLRPTFSASYLPVKKEDGRGPREVGRV